MVIFANIAKISSKDFMFDLGGEQFDVFTVPISFILVESGALVWAVPLYSVITCLTIVLITWIWPGVSLSLSQILV